MTLKIEHLNLKIGDKEILKDISCEFYPGINHAIIGINGAGKSMLIKSIIGIWKATGKITFNGEELKLEDISYLSQLGSVRSNLSVFEIVLLGIYNELNFKVTNDQKKRVIDIIEELNISHLINKKFNNLSGGQKQMVLLGQALISNPKILFLDEPTSALDLKHQLKLFETVNKYNKENGCITLCILHDLTLVSRFSQKTLVLNHGEILEYGDTDEVLKKCYLEDAYGVTLDIERNKRGYLTIMPYEIKNREELL